MQEELKKQMSDTLGQAQKKINENQFHMAPKKPEGIFNCPHTDKKQYAKNMCHKCYHSRGKAKMAYSCDHTDKPHYSNGMCQSCYLAQYYLKRKAKQQAKLEQKGSCSQA